MTYAVGYNGMLYEACLEEHKKEKKSMWAIITGGETMNALTKEKIEFLYLVFSLIGLSMLFIIAFLLS